MISPELLAHIALAEAEGAITLEALPSGTLLRVRTGSSVYTMLVVDPKEGKVVLHGPRPGTQTPQVYFYGGASAGGSGMVVGKIAVGLKMRAYPGTGGILETSAVRGIEGFDDETIRTKFQAVAEAFDRRESLSPEELDKGMHEMICKHFAPDDIDRVLEFVRRFCPEGQFIMLGILDRAREANKLDDAFRVLERHYAEHWVRRPPPFRGSFITLDDVRYVEAAYAELGIPSPARESAP